MRLPALPGGAGLGTDTHPVHVTAAVPRTAIFEKVIYFFFFPTAPSCGGQAAVTSYTAGSGLFGSQEKFHILEMNLENVPDSGHGSH